MMVANSANLIITVKPASQRDTIPKNYKNLNYPPPRSKMRGVWNVEKWRGRSSVHARKAECPIAPQMRGGNPSTNEKWSKNLKVERSINRPTAPLRNSARWAQFHLHVKSTSAIRLEILVPKLILSLLYYVYVFFRTIFNKDFWEKSLPPFFISALKGAQKVTLDGPETWGNFWTYDVIPRDGSSKST